MSKNIFDYSCLTFMPQIYEVVRPLVSLLSLECTLLQNMEAMMALTNLAGISDRLRLATRGKSLLRLQLCLILWAPSFEGVMCLFRRILWIQPSFERNLEDTTSVSLLALRFPETIDNLLTWGAFAGRFLLQRLPSYLTFCPLQEVVRVRPCPSRMRPMKWGPAYLSIAHNEA